MSERYIDSVDGAFSLVVGGSGLSKDVLPLIQISGAAILIAVVLTACRKERKAAPAPTSVNGQSLFDFSNRTAHKPIILNSL